MADEQTTWSSTSTTGLAGWQPGVLPPVPASADPFSATEDDLRGGPTFAFDDAGWVEELHPAPTHGWRRALWRATRGRYRPAPDADEARARALLSQVRRPFDGARAIAVVSTKGGVGKTTTALNLGHALASTRGDRVVALDANPDAGSLGYRVERQTTATASDLLALPEEITGYQQVRRFTSQAPSRLEVIASADDPHQTRRLGRDDYVRLLDLLRRQYNLILADCGTGILDPAARGVVQSADHLVVVTSAGVDAARAVTYLLSWLQEHGMAEKVRRATVVINGVRADRQPVDVDRVREHFATLVRDVVAIPFDEELSSGAVVQLEWLDVATRQAYLRLAASIVEDAVADEAATSEPAAAAATSPAGGRPGTTPGGTP